MRKHISLTLSLGILGLAAAMPATLRSATLQPPSGLCVQTLLGLNCATTPAETSGVKWHPGHYVLDNVAAAVQQRHITGSKNSYFWRDLEPKRGQYDFSAIEHDLAALQRHGKRLFAQISFKAFNHRAAGYLCAPQYVWDMGGVFAVRYDELPGDRGAGKEGLNKCMAKIVDPRVAERFAALAHALGKRFNGEPYFEGVSLPETANTGGKDVAVNDYVEALKYVQKEFKAAFPNTVVLQMANWLVPGADHLMRALVQHAYDTKIGISGPDLMPHRPTSSSVLHPVYYGKMPLGIDNQRAEQVGVSPNAAWDYAVTDPKGLRVNYLFWYTRANGIWDFENKIVPLVNSNNGWINTPCPANISCSRN